MRATGVRATGERATGDSGAGKPAEAQPGSAGLRIERFDAGTDKERLASCFEISVESWPVDQPGIPPWSLDAFAGKWAVGYDSSPRQAWLGSDPSGEAIGCYLLGLPDTDNTSLARVILKVAPSQRRAGAGRALLAHCAAQARAAGRTRLSGQAWDDTAGAAFGAAMGARAGIAEITRTLSIDEGHSARLAELRRAASSHAAGYSLLSFVGATPEEHLEGAARVHGAMADAPRDKGVEASAWNADRLRRMEKLAIDHGVEYYTVAAQSDRDGEMVALTQMCTDPGAPGWGIQQLTAVRAEHRGHRLGLLVKIAMLDLLATEAPEVRHIFTSNAGANDHMIAVNEMLGFKVTAVSRSWELDL